MGRSYNNSGMSSLLGNDSVNILATTNTDNSREYICIIRCYAIAFYRRMEEVFYVVRAATI
jgi:hypothetical protein